MRIKKAPSLLIIFKHLPRRKPPPNQDPTLTSDMSTQSTPPLKKTRLNRCLPLYINNLPLRDVIVKHVFTTRPVVVLPARPVPDVVVHVDVARGVAVRDRLPP